MRARMAPPARIRASPTAVVSFPSCLLKWTGSACCPASQTSSLFAVQTIALLNGDSAVRPASPVQVADAKLPGTSDSANFYQLQGDHLRLSFETPAEDTRTSPPLGLFLGGTDFLGILVCMTPVLSREVVGAADARHGRTFLSTRISVS